jgi:hypothetical protein
VRFGALRCTSDDFAINDFAVFSLSAFSRQLVPSPPASQPLSHNFVINDFASPQMDPHFEYQQLSLSASYDFAPMIL